MLFPAQWVRVATVAATLLFVAGSASGQDREAGADAEVSAEAQAAFRRGVEAAQRELWAESRDFFSRAYALTNRPIVLINLAAVQFEAGAWVEAAASYRRFLAVAATPQELEQAAAARESLRDIEAQVPRLRLTVQNGAPDDTIVLDSEPVDPAVIIGEILVNPGTHALSVRRGSVVLVRETFEAVPSQSTEVTLRVPPMTVPDPTLELALDPDPDLNSDPSRERAESPGNAEILASSAPTSDRSIARSPWLWSGVGVAIVGAVTVGILLSRGGNDGEVFTGTAGRWEFP